ncbi:MAG TPA: DUF3179 domain-containing (seleno)protein [Chthonomonadales bacterium]|nr:DUF3179 domain-containing (seleno)protein [Chthonomonadales bacterium]
MRAWLTASAVLAIGALPCACPARSHHLHFLKSHRAHVNSSKHSEIAPDIKPAALWDGRNDLDFQAADCPRMVTAANARFLDNNEYVLGLTIHGESRAYPTRFVAWHHIINDKVGLPEWGPQQPVAITYCVVCNTGIRFDPIVDGKPVKFDFYGLYNGVVTMIDRDTHSVWLQVGGRAVKGRRVGATLKTGPLLDTTWAEWKALHPDTLVMAPVKGFEDAYEPREPPFERGLGEFPQAYFRKTITHWDHRLAEFEMVLAVSSPRNAQTGARIYRAYPLKTIRRLGVVNQPLGDAQIAVLCDPATATATVVNRELDGKVLTFELRKENGKALFVDRETGTRWSVEGHALAGPLAGKSLRRLNSCLSEWYGWSAYFPQTQIFHI